MATTSDPAPSSTPSVTPTPSPTAPPALASLQIGPQGLGPLAIGSPVPAQAKQTAVVRYKADNCLLNGKIGQPYVGAWLPNYPVQKTNYGDGSPFTMLTNRGDRTGSVRLIVSWSSTILTSTGITVGSTEAQVKAAYPKPSYILKGNNTRMYVIDAAPGRMIIEVADAGAYWEPDEVGTVLWIIVQRSDVKAQSIAGTDGVGSCGA